MLFDFGPQAVVATVLSALGLYGAFHFFRRRLQKDGEKVNWSPLEAVGLTVAIYFASQLVVALGLGVFVSLFNISESQLASNLEGTIPQFMYILFVEVLTVGLLYQFMKRRKTPWAAIGFVRPRLRDIPYALGGFAVYFVGYAFIVASLVEKYLPIDTDQRQELGFDTSAAGPELIFIFLSLVILPPLVEEILVRGFLFTGLRNKLPLLSAAIVTSVVFAVAHLQWGGDAPLLWSAAVDTFVLSMVLVYVRHRTGSLWPGIGIHFIKNGIAFLALFVFKVF
jgi:membrane protease YdiL (CAAX protease family)